MLTFLILAAIVAFFVDIALTYSRYGLLVFAGEKVAREIALVMNENPDPSGGYSPSNLQLRNRIRSEVRAYLASLGFDASTVDFTSVGAVYIEKETDRSNVVERCYLVIEGLRWESVRVMGSSLAIFDLTARTKALIEDPCYVC
jgi:hypothetical protein